MLDSYDRYIFKFMKDCKNDRPSWPHHFTPPVAISEFIITYFLQYLVEIVFDFSHSIEYEVVLTVA